MVFVKSYVFVVLLRDLAGASQAGQWSHQATSGWSWCSWLSWTGHSVRTLITHPQMQPLFTKSVISHACRQAHPHSVLQYNQRQGE